MEAMEYVDVLWYNLCTFLVIAVYHRNTLALICNVNSVVSAHMQNVSKEHVSIIIHSERKYQGHEKLGTETCSTFNISTSAYFIFLNIQ
jgi:hypothetical protein